MNDEISRLAHEVAEKIDDLIIEHKDSNRWYKNTYKIRDELSEAIVKLVTEAVKRNGMTKGAP